MSFLFSEPHSLNSSWPIYNESDILFLDSKSNYSLEALIEIMKDLDLNEGTILHAFSK